jgi:hypothetical protein
MKITTSATVNLNPLAGLMKGVLDPGGPENTELLIRCIVRYKKYAQAQFRKNSAGGGLWPALSPNTKKVIKKKSRKILSDSDTLLHMLDPVPSLERNPRPGIITVMMKNGVKITFGGAQRHPLSKRTVRQLAIIHHEGLGRMPARPILIPPTEQMLRLCAKDGEKVINKGKRKRGMK